MNTNTTNGELRNKRLMFQIKKLKYLNRKMYFALKKAQDMNNNVKACVAENDTNLSDIAGFAVEDYRFSNSYRFVIKKLPAEDRNKYESTYNFHTDKVNEILGAIGLKIVCFDGKDFDEGLPVTPLNSDEFGPLDDVVISQTIEPTVIDDKGHAIKFGTVILDKKK